MTAYSAHAQTAYTELTKLVASDRQAGDHFGCSVSISGNAAIVGAYWEDIDPANTSAGAAYIYELDSIGNWAEVQKVVAFTRDHSEVFGWSVDISGDYAIAGSTGKSEDTNDDNFVFQAGAAYIFERDVNGIWQQAQMLVANPTDRDVFDNFGWKVAISGNYAVVVARNEDYDANGFNYLSDAAAAYIYERDGGGTWNLIQKITPTDREADDEFGSSIAIDGDYIIVGTHLEGMVPEQQSGAAYVFKRDGSGTWNETQKLTATIREAYAFYGWSVALKGDRAIVGAMNEDAPLLPSSGAAYFYELDTATGTWNFAERTQSSDIEIGDFYGYSVAIEGDSAIVGARSEDHDLIGGSEKIAAGAAYVYEHDSITSGWNEVQKIIASDRGFGDFFGSSAAMSGGHYIISSRFEDEDALGQNTAPDAGSAYIFGRCTPPDIPTLSVSPSICSGASMVITISGNLNDATMWHLYYNACGDSLIDATSNSTITVVPDSSTTYYIRGANGCMSSSCASIVVTPDTTGPTVSCQNLTGFLDTTGSYSITPMEVLDSTIACSFDSLVLDRSFFYCSDLGINTVNLVAWLGGQSDTCSAAVTVAHTLSLNAVAGNGAIDLIVTGGLPPYTFDWDNDGTGDNDDTEDLNNLSTGMYAVLVTDSIGCIDTLSIYITSTIGVTEDKFSDEIHVYPNPNKGVFTLQLNEEVGEFNVTIFNLLGQEVYHSKGTGKEHQFDVSSLKPANYILAVFSEERIVYKRITVQ
jgi:hypothetical protein